MDTETRALRWMGLGLAAALLALIALGLADLFLQLAQRCGA